MRNILILFNPVAGGRRGRRLRAVLDLLQKCDARVELRTTGAPGDARRFAGEADDDVDTIVAAGGDGTINEVVNGMAARGTGGPDLALLPLGTANVLAAEIGFRDLSARRIANTIAEGASRDLYLGRADSRYFALMCGVGFDAHVVARVTPHLKRRLGKLAYVLASLVELWRYRPRRYAVTLDGRRHDAASAIVANAHFYGGRYVVAPRARIDEAELPSKRSLNVAALGMLSRHLPIGEEAWRAAIRANLPAATHEMNFEAFALGARAADAQDDPA